MVKRTVMVAMTMLVCSVVLAYDDPAPSITSCLLRVVGNKACTNAGMNNDGCTDDISQNGACDSVKNNPVGRKSSENYDRTCVYTKKKPNPDGAGCVVDGGPVTFIASCVRPEGDACGGGIFSF